MEVARQDVRKAPRRAPDAARDGLWSCWRACLLASALLAASIPLRPEPASAQFGFNLGGFNLRGLNPGGSRGGYGGHVARPPRMSGPGGIYGGGARPRPYPGRPAGTQRPYPGPTGMQRPYPGPTGMQRPYPGPTGMQRPAPRPQWPYPRPHRPYPTGPVVVQPKPPVYRPPISRPPVYRPPIVVQGRPYRPPVMIPGRPYRPVQPRPPIVVAQPPMAKPLRLAPLRPIHAAPVLRPAPPAPPPTGARPAPPLPPPPGPVAASDGTYVDREVIVELAGPQPPAVIEQLAAQNGLTRLASADLTLAGTTVHRLRVNGRRSVDSVVAALSRDGRVALAQRNHLYRLTVDAGQAYYPLATNQYAATKLRLVEAHRLATGAGVTVAVIDSGVDTGHPELQGAIGGSENTLSSAAAPDTHGTAIAGAIAARGQLMGVAPGTRILAIRAFSPATARAQAEGTSWDVTRAVDLAGKSGARIVNMSFAGPADRLLSRELAGGLQRGIIFVAAAGNAGPTAPAAYPAAEPGVIAVTATDPQDRLYESANRGPYVAVAAPGVDILVATPESGYDTSTGTSVAAAHVSGIVALMLQRYGSLSPAAVRAALTENARDLGPPGPDPEFGAGLVDAYAVLGGRDVPVASAPPPPPAAQGSPPPAPVAAAEPVRMVPASGPSAPSPAGQGSPPPPPTAMPAAPAPAAQGSPPPPPVASAEPTQPLPASGPPAPSPSVPGSPPPPPAATPPAPYAPLPPRPAAGSAPPPPPGNGSSASAAPGVAPSPSVPPPPPGGEPPAGGSAIRGAPPPPPAEKP